VSENESAVSQAFQTFLAEAPEQAKAWGTAVRSLGHASALDAKTGALAYLAVLAALNRPSGVVFHARAAKQAGASRDEVISAILVGLPAAGHVVTQSLPPAVKAYDAED
jgi:alkylhydroperoxidase/carboxymuconolactone decarboxylase family protein YurZ